MAATHAVRRNKVGGDSKPRVWSARVCPFAERVLFALNELKIDYEPMVISLSNKPPRLLEINPEGKVPVIEDRGVNIYESLVCLEYLDEEWESPSGKRLLPTDTVQRALHRIVAAAIGEKVVPKFYGLLRAKDDESMKKLTQELLSGISFIDSKMRDFSVEGPFFTGEELGFLDMVLMPHVRRLFVLEAFRGFSIPDTPEYARFNKWVKACLKHPAYEPLVKEIPNEEILEAYKPSMNK